MTSQDEADSSKQTKGPVTKEKLRTVMEAASALTALGDEESEGGSRPTSPSKEEPKTAVTEPAKESVEKKDNDSTAEDGGKRYLPEHKKPDAALTFPEKLMKLMVYADKQEKDFCVAWMEDGKSFIIRKPDDFTRNVVPKFFKSTKFSSFTRKLYRWGFRQVNRGIGPDDPIIFGNEFFQRDNAELMAKMRSVTAAGNRKAEQKNLPQGLMMPPYTGMKHALDNSTFDEGTHKRMMLDHIYQHNAGMLAQNASRYGGMSAGGSLSLTSALRPNMGAPPHMMGGGNMMGMPGPNGQSPMNFDMMRNNGMPMHQFMPSPQGSRGNGNNSQSGGSNPGSAQQQGQQGQYPNSASTAEIVNAAIAALRYSN